MLVGYKRTQTSVILRVKLFDSSVSTGAGKTGLGPTSSGLIISTIADNEATPTYYSQVASPTEIETITTLGTYAAPSTGCCRFKEVDATRHKGIYELQFADARFAVANAKFLLISISGVSNMAEMDLAIPLRDLDPYSTEVTGIKSKTDSLTFTQAGHVDANIQRVNDVLVNGTGAPGDEWGP